MVRVQARCVHRDCGRDVSAITDLSKSLNGILLEDFVSVAMLGYYEGQIGLDG